MLAQYETNTQPAKTGQKKETDLKNYFTTYLPDGVNTKTKRVRILPSPKAGTTPFVEVMVHSIQVKEANGSSQWRKFICPKHEKDEACPFCDAREQLYASGKEEDKELAKIYGARKMYVVKLIDREFEAEGPKFWRFNHDYRKTGILDKIQIILQATGDFTNTTTGRDLLITIARDQNNRPVVQGIIHTDPSVLSADEALAKSWLEDARTWEDVYAIKSYDYLEIIVKGGIPVWDKEGKKYVDKNSIVETTDSSEEELSIGNATPAATAPVVKTVTVEESTEFPDADEDDLPF